MMTTREFNAQRARIRRLLKRWRQPLGLDEWFINLVYSISPLEVNGEFDSDALACTTTVWAYRRATIEWNIPSVADHSDAELEHAFIHEAVHVISNEYHMPGPEHDEHATETITYAIERAYRLGAQLGKA